MGGLFKKGLLKGERGSLELQDPLSYLCDVMLITVNHFKHFNTNFTIHYLYSLITTHDDFHSITQHPPYIKSVKVTSNFPGLLLQKFVFFFNSLLFEETFFKKMKIRNSNAFDIFLGMKNEWFSMKFVQNIH